MIDAEQLLTFLEVAEKGSVTDAAKKMHRGQSAISERLKHLSEYVGEPLYERDGNGISLTRFGELLLGEIKQLKQNLANIDGMVSRRKSLLDGDLFIFSTNLITNYFLLPYIVKFKIEYPGINLHIKNGENYISDFSPNVVDVLFYETEMSLPALPTYFESSPWKDDGLVFIAARNHSLADQPVIDVSMLKEETIIWRDSHTAVRKATEKQFTNSKIIPKHTIEVEDIESVGFMVQSGLGVGFVSERVAKHRQDWNVVSIPIVNHDIIYTHYMSAPKKIRRSPALQGFIDILESDVAEFEH
ncbi:LysR family transcriptional regulator [Acidithiobacillus sp. IBUN Pt1247-S3]|uniref:LysR family transcriptional regulator n=1 Tax=Acidithiobacillus sp. IBUN Pt1247-S3 TaxID=3166642 RepID=UPI0034E4C5E3